MSKCIEFQGCRDENGYGRWNEPYKNGKRGKHWYTHRLAYTHFYGPINPGYFILHSCDNPPCINPLHLRQGSHRENMKDMTTRNRQNAGEDRYNAKITEDDVRAIRADTRIQRVIGADYGITQRQVSHIKNRKKWAWVS